ncbi:MAG TPA: PQQ-binding-like beta-propeller repeat protein, partial [Ktedonobacterales bacterium]
MPRLILRRATLPVLQRPHTIRQRVRRATVRVALLSLILWAGAASLQFSASATAFAAPLATADDWPTFLHDPARSAASGDTTLSTTNAAQLAKLWSYKTGGVVAASPTIVAGTVYVGSWDGYEYALDAATGALKWKTYLGVTNAPGCSPPSAGISSAATVLNSVVYVGGGDSNWYALDATTGAILWSVYTGDNSATGGHYNWASPLIYNGSAYIGIASLGDCPLVQGQLLRVDLTTHQIVATYNVVPNGQVGGGIWTSPALDTATNTIYVTTGTENNTSQLYAQALLALDGTTLTLKDSWKLPESLAVTDSDFGTTPILFSDAAGDQLVGAINKNGMFYAFKRNNLAGGPFWQQQVAVGGDCPQ